MTYTVVALRWFIGAVFLIAMMMKVRPSAWSDFTATMRALVGAMAIPVLPVAVGVILAEAVCAVLLATLAIAGFALAFSLLLVMIGAIVVTIRRKVEITCPCFGTSATRLGVRHVVRNSVLAAAALTGLLAAATGPSLQLPTSATIIAAVAGVLAAGVVAMLDEIMDLFTNETSVSNANRSNV